MEKSKEFLLSENAWRDLDIYSKIYEYSLKKPQNYWLTQAERLDWINHPTNAFKISEDKGFKQAIWFNDGNINACYNCVDRHASKHPDKVALIWQSENLEKVEKYTYKQLQEEVCKFANTLKQLGLTKDNFVTIYMPMIPEAAFACFACARLGMPYSSVFAGFSPNAIALRMKDSKSDFIITTDGIYGVERC